MCAGGGSRAKMTLGQTIFPWGFLSQLSLSWSLRWRVLCLNQNKETKLLCWKKSLKLLLLNPYSAKKKFHHHNTGLFWILHDGKTPQLWGFGSSSFQRQESHVWKPQCAGLNFWDREMPNHSLVNWMWEVEINAFTIEKKKCGQLFLANKASKRLCRTY